METIGDFTVTSRTFLRDDQSGRFLSAAHEGARSAVGELASTLADLVRSALVDSGLVRTGDLVASVDEYRVSDQEGGITVGAQQAASMESGEVDHWIPNAFGRGVAVFWRGRDPGAKVGFGYVRQAAAALTAISGAIVRKHMP